jgi:hypothetical protein
MGSAPRPYNDKFQRSSELSEVERVQLKKNSVESAVVTKESSFETPACQDTSF